MLDVVELWTMEKWRRVQPVADTPVALPPQRTVDPEMLNALVEEPAKNGAGKVQLTVPLYEPAADVFVSALNAVKLAHI